MTAPGLTAVLRRETFRQVSAPCIHSGHSDRQMLAAWTLAASLVGCCGIVLYGFGAFHVIVLSVGAAMGCEALIAAFQQGRDRTGMRHALLTGLLLALTLPATVPWYVPCTAAAAAIIPATWLLGGFGHYVWQPAVVGRVLVQFLFAQHLSFGQALVQSPVLVPDRLLIGDLMAADPIPLGHYRGWSHAAADVRRDAFLIERPVQTLRRLAEGELSVPAGSPLTTTLRDFLPPWEDTVRGTVPGGIGETSVIALIVVGLYLIYRGYLRWQIPVFGLAAAAIMAGVLPIELPGSGPGQSPRWLPGLAVEGGHAVGMEYVLFQLTSGELMLCLFLLAGDWLARPMTARGQAIFAVGIGAIALLLRRYGPAECAGYWAILIMNTLVPVIDRGTRRRPLGSTPARIRPTDRVDDSPVPASGTS
jgi:electron transport complex protein RnfD